MASTRILALNLDDFDEADINSNKEVYVGDGGNTYSYVFGQDEKHRGTNTRSPDTEKSPHRVGGVPKSSPDDAGVATGTSAGAGVGSEEFVNLVKAQFDVLVTMLGASQIALFFRRENAETGALEFVPVMVYPEQARVWVIDAKGIEVQEAPKALPWTESAADVLPQYPFISVRKRNDDLETPDAVVDDDSRLSAPLVYASLMLGMITVWKGTGDSIDAKANEGTHGDSEQAERRQITKLWTDQDKDLLEKVASSVAMAAMLDQRQRWAAVVQVEQLRRVLSETLHQVKNPMTALRTFGKLLLRRLPREDTLNRELAKDIILQSDRLVDLLLPVDTVIGHLAHAVSSDETEAGPYAQIEGLAAAAGFAAAAADNGAEACLATEIGEGVQDAVVQNQTHDVDDNGEVPLRETPLASTFPAQNSMELLFVQDAIEPVMRAAAAVAQTRRISFRWRVDEDLPGVMGDDRALEEALSNVIENALKYCNLGRREEDAGDSRPMVVLRARAAADSDWGTDSGVVIEVVDNGSGIRDEDIPYIFDRGFRGEEARTLGIPGSGLGLGIARDVMNSMGGDLQMTNSQEPGWGACAMLYLPRRVRAEN